MDQAKPFRIENQSETLRPAQEMWLVSSFDRETAARLAYQEQFSIGRVIVRDFAQAETQPYDWTKQEEEVFTRERFGSDVEAFQAFWKHILGGLKESGSVKHFRQVEGQVKSESEMANVFRAFERSVARAFEKVPLTEKQRNHFREVYGERDFAMMSQAIELAGQVAEAKDRGVTFDQNGDPSEKFEPRHNPFAQFVVYNPKLRPMQYWDSKEARGYLRRFGNIDASEVAKGKMKRDLSDVEELDRAA